MIKFFKNYFIDLLYGGSSLEIPDNVKDFDAAFVEA